MRKFCISKNYMLLDFYNCEKIFTFKLYTIKYEIYFYYFTNYLSSIL